MHGATTKRTFGEFADMSGENKKPYRLWNTYLAGYLRHFGGVLEDLGYSSARIKQLRRHLRATNFPKTGRYIHGDPSPRNILVSAQRPLEITFIDPNPIVGHPTWDIAIIANNAEIARRKAKLRPQNEVYQAEAKWRGDYHKGVIAGYVATTKRQLRSAHLALVRLIHLLMITDFALRDARAEGRDLAEDATIRAHRELMADLMSKVLTPPDAK
jgi:aminoglycoside phosphotransferase (APT) family kinase protein